MDKKQGREFYSLLRQAREGGRKLFAGYIRQADGTAHVILLADKSKFVCQRLKQFEPELLTIFQELYPAAKISRISVVDDIKNKDAKAAVMVGGKFRVFRGEKSKEVTYEELH